MYNDCVVYTACHWCAVYPSVQQNQCAPAAAVMRSYLYNNSLEGTLPAEWSALSSLSALYVEL